MKMVLFTAAIVALFAATVSSCSDDTGSVGGTDADSDADSDTDSDTEDWTDVATCMDSCASAADCAYDGSSLFDADNYECDEMGHCVYLGCKTDQECIDSYGEEYGCGDDPGLASIPSCVRTCAEAGDCAEEYGLGAHDYDNYECLPSGYCKYLGCHDSDECFETHGTTDYECLEAQFLPISTCQRTCATAADCDTAAGDAYDADNYICEDSRCIYTGCNSSGECEETAGMGDGWQCVES